MSENENTMKPIWFFVGLILMVMGVIVLAAGIYYLFVPDYHKIELPGLHINIWWGIILIISGVVLTYLNRKPIEV